MSSVDVQIEVIGFSDVERHALNTVFRLSQEREVCYGPWLPGTGQLVGSPPVLLVDSESAEAVLVLARAPREGQRLIWVGEHAPAHAWRVLKRPIAWASLLHDLDNCFAAVQSDSGFLDLDVTEPVPLGSELGEFKGVERRALLVGLADPDLAYLRECLGQAAVSEVDEALSSERAAGFMAQHHQYTCGVFNLDDHHIDAWGLMELFRDRYPQAMTLATSEHAGWWRRRRLRHHTQRLGISGLLLRPLQPDAVARYLELL